METIRYREQVARLITEEADALTELVTFLEREHEQLSSSDVTALEGTIREHQRGVARVVQADQARVALCHELGYEADADGLRAVLRWCDPQGTLAPQWAHCSDIAARCRTLNDRNGALVSARLRHVQARLAALVQGREGVDMSYGPRGAYASADTGQVVKVDV